MLRDRPHRRLRVAVAVAVATLAVALATGPAAIAATPVLHEVAKLLPSDGTERIRFGFSVAASGDALVIAAAESEPHGAAYVYERDGDGTWTEVAKLTPTGGIPVRFGHAVSIAGDTVAVGDHEAHDLVWQAGAVDVFERDDAGTWSPAARLLASDGGSFDTFGSSVAVDGDTLVVGSPRDDDSGGTSGSAYVFERDPAGAWSETAKLLASDGADGDWFGNSVGVAGGRIVVGARNHDHWVVKENAGSAYVFERDEVGTWSETAELLAPDLTAGDEFGYSVAIGGDAVVVGAHRDDTFGEDAGSAYVFERDAAGEWPAAAKLRASDRESNSRFGISVSVSGGTAVVGASEHPQFTHTGAAYAFRRDEGGGWREMARLLASDADIQDDFGYAVAVSGDVALVGAKEDDDLGTNSGSAYVFSLEECVLALRLDSPVVRPGEELTVELYLRHERAQTVTVPFVLWIEDEAGNLLVERTTPPQTFHHGDVVRSELTLSIPDGARPGVYRVRVGIDRMQQGVAAAEQAFRVVASRRGAGRSSR